MTGDPTLADAILDRLVHNAHRLTMALVLISHDLGVVSALADRIVVMYAGRIASAGAG